MADLSRQLRALGKTAAFPIAVLSLLISLTTLILNYGLNPDLKMEASRVVRVGQVKPDGRAYLLIQPTITSIGRSTRAEVLQDIKLQVQPKGTEDAGNERTQFEWMHYGKFTFDPDHDPPIRYEFVGDPAPLLVTSTAPLVPVLYFQAPKGWYFEEGTYVLKITAVQTVDGWPKKLKEDVEVTLKQDDITYLDEQNGKLHLLLHVKDIEEPRWSRFREWIS